MKKVIARVYDRLLGMLIRVTPDPFLVAELWRKRGVCIGDGTCIYRDVVLGDTGNLIQIGRNCVLTGCAILAHDASTDRLLGIKYGEKSIAKPVVIEDNCFIGYGAIILMGVRVGRGAIVGAGAVVTRSVAPNSVVVGNPAKVLCTVEELVKKRSRLALDEIKNKN